MLPKASQHGATMHPKPLTCIRTPRKVHPQTTPTDIRTFSEKGLPKWSPNAPKKDSPSSFSIPGVGDDVLTYFVIKVIPICNTTVVQKAPNATLPMQPME